MWPLLLRFAGLFVSLLCLTTLEFSDVVLISPEVVPGAYMFLVEVGWVVVLTLGCMGWVVDFANRQESENCIRRFRVPEKVLLDS